MSELRADGLKKRYKSRTVVRDASLSVTSGEVVGLLGPNGAGKTTCFYMIVGLVPVDGGSIFLDERDLSQMPMHERAHLGLSYLPQEASIFRRLSVADNILAVLELKSYSVDETQQHLEELLHDLHISHIRSNPGISLSGGERRRVEIARALATIRVSFCWMSLLRASILLRSWISRKLYSFSRIGRSECSSLTITSGRPWVFATAHTLSATAPCWRAVGPMKSFIMKM